MNPDSIICLKGKNFKYSDGHDWELFQKDSRTPRYGPFANKSWTRFVRDYKASLVEYICLNCGILIPSMGPRIEDASCAFILATHIHEL